ncbi:MAG: (d)CMP kinase [Pseudomonadota bacterium]|nr:MAG: (d)CMP kinase [Pseudomonadota bacterium]
MKRPIVAIDGPAGAGKSTVARLVADRLGYLLLDTGALYRTVALAAKRAGIPWGDEAAVTGLTETLVRDGAIRLERGGDGALRTLLRGEDVSTLIRTQELAEGASRVSAIAGVREALLTIQRSAVSANGVVLEGRDIGTVVFPDAQAKFFLTASVEVRARRRFDELRSRGQSPELERVHEEVVERDRRDSTRPVAPLRQAPDAVLIDSSALSVEAVVDRIVERVRAIERELEQS